MKVLRRPVAAGATLQRPDGLVMGGFYHLIPAGTSVFVSMQSKDDVLVCLTDGSFVWAWTKVQNLVER